MLQVGLGVSATTALGIGLQMPQEEDMYDLSLVIIQSVLLKVSIILSYVGTTGPTRREINHSVLE